MFTERGSVTFRVAMVHADSQTLDYAADRATLHFTIEDTGVGISPDQYERIFQPFEQSGAAQQRAAGTGLGLTISQQFIEHMGGRIELQSQLGQGSLFWFDLCVPILSSISTPAAAPAQLIFGYSGQRRRILVVDDHRANRMVLLGLLEPLGFEVILAEHGREGVEQARRCRPDLIFMDLVMPVMMGFEAVPAIRSIPELANVPIIVVSASVLEMDREQSLRVGCDGFLTKPIDAEAVLAELHRHLQLEWRYSQASQAPVEPPTEQQPSFIATKLPPLEQLEALYEQARLGNMERIQQLLRQLEQQQPEFSAFARKLGLLADHFEDEQILNLLQQYLAETQPALSMTHEG